MQEQSQIKSTLLKSIDVVREMLNHTQEAEAAISRVQVARAVCSRFGLFDARGHAQVAGCSKALVELERAGSITLPAPLRRGGGAGSARRLDEAVPPPQDVPAQAGQVVGLELVPVIDLAQLRMWNELMAREHPQGAVRQVGAQMRYLISSQHGWLGGLGFAAAALKLADRDAWIGWDAQTRRRHLHRVVGMSRFLIRPSVRCHNLASQVLGLALRRLPTDFQQRYAYEPWLLESFVDTTQFAGTCYQASNWIRVGRTRGRGRQDRRSEHAKPVKDIYVYPLVNDLRSRLGVPAAPAAPPPASLDSAQWALHEFGGAQLGDQRRSQRLIEVAQRQANEPRRAFCGAAQGDSAASKAYYRLIDQPDESAVTMQAILAPHQQRTCERMRLEPVVLCIADGTDMNYTGLAQCSGLGPIGTNQTGASAMGLHLHSTLAVNDQGLPLGLLAAHCQAPPAKAPVPAEISAPKKTHAWCDGLRRCAEAAAAMPKTLLICVMDREADFFDLFDQQRQPGQPTNLHLLVRAKHDRRVAQAPRADGGHDTADNSRGEPVPDKLFAAVRHSPAQCRLQVQVPRQSARPKRSKQKQRPARQRRTAQVDLHYQAVELHPPAPHRGQPPLKLWVVHVHETATPADGSPPLRWTLLTTVPIESPQQAQECLRRYSLRWRIEDWHRVLKDGCDVEALQHKTAERLKRALAIHMVIAWRIMAMTLMGRQCPGLPPDLLFSDLELQVLTAYAQKKSAAADHAG